MKFWVTINGDIGEKGGESLWGHIGKYAGVNLTQLFDQSFVYGDASKYIIRDVIYQCSLLGKPIQLNTPITPSK